MLMINLYWGGSVEFIWQLKDSLAMKSLGTTCIVHTGYIREIIFKRLMLKIDF